MARTVRDTRLDSRTARGDLKVSGKPYYRSIDSGLHLGYRKGKRGGKWVVRWYKGSGEYRVETIGIADDIQDADGVTVYDFSQAQAKARGLFQQWGREAEGVEEPTGPYTVRETIKDYMADYESRSGKSTSRMWASINANILPTLGDIEVRKLTRKKIKGWHHGFSKSPARLRTRKGKTQQFRPPPTDQESIRRRKSTANKMLTTLKAALNHALDEGRVASGDAWVSVKPFKAVDAPTVRYLTDEEITRLVNACPSALRSIVQAALLTGLRYGEIAGLKVKDFDPNAGTVSVAVSKGGKSRHVVLTDEGRRLFKQVTAGQPGGNTIFRRDGGGKWGNAHQTRPLREACKTGEIDPAIGFHILRHTYASRLARRGVPMKVIADQLGHADTRMTEKHYAHLSPSYVSETVRAAFDDMGIVEETNVETLRPRAS